ncbi:hypothetical protein H4219_004061 [Mycoemilia scoparia]|uniref:Sulfide:quinone oxidoreductase, mitochondrial n=1 Tax=Mycoemilia scoparia TaxID=417184 RepID=A0A9W8A0Z5_9FUNG|nr:hypothetical protein H4219_004061 [Mycoemilia scoparia]
MASLTRISKIASQKSFILKQASGASLYRFFASAASGSPSSYKVVVIGGGAGGLSVASTLSEKLGSGEVAVVEPSPVHNQQPLWTFVGAGIKSMAETQRPTSELIPQGSVWIKEAAAEIDPDQNSVKLANGQKINYDYLVVAAGIKLDFEAVKGLSSAIGKNGVASNYSADYVEKTWEYLQNFKGGNAVFTMPSTPIKCAGAPQKIAYLAEEYLREKGLRDKSNIVYNTGLGKIFAIDKYAEALTKVAESRGVKVNLFHDLVEVKPEERKAIFKITGSTPAGPVGETVEIPYDFLHVTPPMKAHEFLKNSKLSNGVGFVDVDQSTLRHTKYKNVYSLGDCSSLPTSKTAAAVAAQSGVVKDNLLANINGVETPTSTYNGYTSCPLITGKNKLILAEFSGYTGKPLETFAFDQSKENPFSYWLTSSVIPNIYWNSFLSGSWRGPGPFRRFLNPGDSN